MKVLVVYSYNNNRVAPFISEQIESLRRLDVRVETFGIVGKGIKGYLSNRKLLLKQIKSFQPDIIHAHYGLSGLLANLQRRIPVITTYHGSDINQDKVLRFSKIAIKLSKYNIFVSQKNISKTKIKHSYSLLPCGVDTDLFYPQEKSWCREQMGLKLDKRYILFAGAFDNMVKNPKLAKEVVSSFENVELIELKGYSRNEVACLMNAVDVCLMTSFSEGSPQFIKEAMACNCPIVSVDVGDVKEVISETKNCFISTYKPDEIATKLKIVLKSDDRTDGSERIAQLNLSLEAVALKLMELYGKVIK